LYSTRNLYFQHRFWPRGALLPGAQAHHRRLEVVKRPEAKKGFVLLPKRWVVERTFAWLVHYRRHRCDYEVLTANSEAMI
jgi:transposase